MKRLASGHSFQKNILTPSYDRRKIEVGIVHLGIGAFHRAHQAFYTDQVLEKDGGDWAICGVSLKRPEVRDQMVPQDGLYSLVEQDASGNPIKIIGAVKEVLFAPEDPEAVLKKMASPDTRVVSLTVTEKGYCHDPASGSLNFQHPDILNDLKSPSQPASAIGFLVQALSLRRDSGIKAFTVLSCDNLPENGKTLQKLVLEFANRRDPDLAKWIEKEATFPCCMVDRIVPATSESDRDEISARLGVRDEAMVVTEPFSQWVIEDDFVNGRPTWENVGAEMVEDVRPFEEMKLRMLNGTHSTLAYLGYLAGREYVSEAVQQPVFEKFLRNMMKEEIMPTLKLPESVNLDQYQNALIERYQNPALKHRLWQIAMDGSQKLPQRLLGTIRDRIATATSFNRLVLAVAGWMRYILGRDEKGNPIEIRDPLAEVYQKISLESGMLQKETPSGTSINAYVSQILSIKEIFGVDLPDNPHFRNAVTREFEKLMNQGALKSVQDLS
ncbi:MAG: mannitol dehydrogenase family protein [Deltaproteobacteria bacterium]